MACLKYILRFFFFQLLMQKYEISGEKLLKRKFAGIGVGMFGGQFGEGNMALEGIANRDSVGYISRYGLDEQQLETMLRGTLRFEGFCEVMHVLKKIGLLAKAHPLRWGNAGPPTRWDQVLEHLGHKIKDGSRSMRVLTE
jgi:alpha-aminoadipic semialdehyde synthase